MKKWLIGGCCALIVAAASVAVVVLQQTARASESLAGLEMVVHKSASCDCCGGWIDTMREQGIEVVSVDTDDIVSVKRDLSVPATHYSCHTAEIGGYVVEGHVPVDALIDLMRVRPDVSGIALGGMPAGSPGMPGVQEAPFEVAAFDGSNVTLFGRY